MWMRRERWLLDRHQNLEDVALLGVPALDAAPRPRAQQREAYLAILVEVGVEAIAVRVVIDPRRNVGVVAGKLNVEEEEAVAVWGASGTLDDRLQQVCPILIHAGKDSRRQVRPQQRPLLLELPHVPRCLWPVGVVVKVP